LSADPRTAWRHGAWLALQCGQCCGNLIAVLLVLGVMDVGAMAAVTAAITLERAAPSGERAARAIGAAVVAAGLFLVARAVLPS
jgi:predicted metal-binding membrane protein